MRERGTDYLVAQGGVVVLVRDAEDRADAAGLDVEHAHDVVRPARGEDAALEREWEAEARELLQRDERGGGVLRVEIDREDAGCHAGRRAWSDSVQRSAERRVIVTYMSLGPRRVTARMPGWLGSVFTVAPERFMHRRVATTLGSPVSLPMSQQWRMYFRGATGSS